MADKEMIAIELTKILAPSINDECCDDNPLHSVSCMESKCTVVVDYYECILKLLNDEVK